VRVFDLSIGALGSGRIRRSWSCGRVARRALTVVALGGAIFWTLFPFYWGTITSFKSGRDNYGNLWLPFASFAPTLRAWQAFLRLPGLDRAMANSVLVSLGAATIAVVLGTPAAYGIARFRFAGLLQGGLAVWFILQRVLPPAIFLSPYILLMRDFGLIDSVLALILINATLNLPLPVIILSGAFRDLPRALEEAAWVDGTGRWGSFSRIGLPLVLPALAASWLLCLAFSWNEWMFGMLLSYTDARTMAVLVYATGGGGGVNFQAASTRAMAAMAVPIICALLSQRYVVRGLSLGAIKG
jgi:multiple sugar transport system permease protein